MDVSVSFVSERFDHSSQLPACYNAGNRFYGADLSAYLCEHLREAGFTAESSDEDWGWLVMGCAAGQTRFEIAVYNLAEEKNDEIIGTAQWGLWIRAFERRRRWRFIPHSVQVPVPAHVRECILAAILEAGAQPENWSVGREQFLAG